MKYIITAHGNYAAACLKSCEMIAGKIENVIPVEFTEELSRDYLIETFKNIICENSNEEFIFLTDLMGGTPYNAAKIVYGENESVKGVVSGISLQMLIRLTFNENINSVISDKENLITFESKCGAADSSFVNGAGTGNASCNSGENGNSDCNGIIHVRIDERLIHGQVATALIGKLGATRVMVIDDNIIKSDVEKAALRAACPNHIKLSILTAENAARRINAGYYSREKVLILVKQPGTARQIYDLGVSFTHINLGNMSKKDGREMIKKSVYASQEERDDLIYLQRNQVEVTAQLVPSDERKSISEYIS